METDMRIHQATRLLLIVALHASFFLNAQELRYVHVPEQKAALQGSSSKIQNFRVADPRANIEPSAPADAPPLTYPKPNREPSKVSSGPISGASLIPWTKIPARPRIDLSVSAKQLKIPAKAQRQLEQGNRAADKNDHKTARKHYAKAIELFPDFSDVYNNLGTIALLEGDVARAERHFIRALEIDDSNLNSLLALAKVRFADHNAAEAEKLTTRFLQLQPFDAEGLTLMALIKLRSGELDEALRICARASESSESGIALTHLVAGLAYESKNDRQQAVAEYQKFLAKSQNGEVAEQVQLRVNSLSASK
jgi:Tfp pilus assembly protein PilF